MTRTFLAASLTALLSAPAFAQTVTVFADIDRDGDNFVTEEEFMAYSPAFTPDVYRFLDSDEDGQIVIKDFESDPVFRRYVTVSPTILRRDAPVVVRRYVRYRAIDRNGDGFISAGELASADPYLTRERYVTADINSDGLIDYDELYDLDYYTRLDALDGFVLPEITPAERGIVFENGMYRVIDENSDGRVSMAELGKIAPDATISEYAALDANNDGIVALPELLASDILDEGIESGTVVLPTTTTTQVVRSGRYVLDSYSFALLDTDDDGTLSKAELQAGFPSATITDIDPDGDGIVRYREFFTSPKVAEYFTSGTVNIPTTRKISVQRSYFTGIDRNRNGVLESDELISVSPTVTETVYGSVDTDGDGVVSYRELYGSDWFTKALETDSIITPTYVMRYAAPQKL